MLWLALFCFTAGTFVKITSELHESDDIIHVIDKTILVKTAEFRMPLLDDIAIEVTALGSVTLVTLFVLINLFFLFLKRDRLGAIQLMVASLGAGLWIWIAKLSIARERPQLVPHLVEVEGFSYPSGHSLIAAAVYLTLAILINRGFPSWRVRSLILLMASMLIGLVGFSRVYVGVHYPSDVASGILLGMAWAFFVASLFSLERVKLFLGTRE